MEGLPVLPTTPAMRKQKQRALESPMQKQARLLAEKKHQAEKRLHETEERRQQRRERDAKAKQQTRECLRIQNAPYLKATKTIADKEKFLSWYDSPLCDEIMDRSRREVIMEDDRQLWMDKWDKDCIGEWPYQSVFIKFMGQYDRYLKGEGLPRVVPGGSFSGEATWAISDSGKFVRVNGRERPVYNFSLESWSLEKFPLSI